MSGIENVGQITGEGQGAPEGKIRSTEVTTTTSVFDGFPEWLAKIKGIEFLSGYRELSSEDQEVLVRQFEDEVYQRNIVLYGRLWFS
jgi:hypothetical protein